MNSKLPESIDTYIATFPKDVQQMLQDVRTTIQKAAPKAEEAISYAMPTFKLNGNLVHFAGYKNHIGFYPAPMGIEAFKKELSVYKGAKGSVQFPLDKPMPLALITKIVKYRIKQNEESAAKKVASKKSSTIKTATKATIKYHKDGTIWAKGKMIGDAPDGYWEWFRKDGIIMRSGYFKDGKQTGDWTTYDKKGNVYKVTTMK